MLKRDANEHGSSKLYYLITQPNYYYFKEIPTIFFPSHPPLYAGPASAAAPACP
jgi:hypothetical protein